MDQTDRQLLQLLEENARLSLADLGKAVSLSSPAVKERLLKLEESGVIQGYTIKVDHKKLGLPVEAYILFETFNCQAFREFCQQEPQLLSYHRLAGKYSYLVHAVTPSMEELEEVIDRGLKYGSSSTHIVFSSYEKGHIFR